MSGDIVERLRVNGNGAPTPNGATVWLSISPQLSLDAADEIERLRAAGDALADALRDETVNGTMAVFNETFVALNLWREARNA